MPGNDSQTVVLWRGPNGCGRIGIPATLSTPECLEMVERIARAMVPSLLSDTEWLSIPRTSLREADWPR